MAKSLSGPAVEAFLILLKSLAEYFDRSVPLDKYLCIGTFVASFDPPLCQDCCHLA